jgi:hypothetical protein
MLININAGIYQRRNISTHRYINAQIYQRRNISTQEYINAGIYQRTDISTHRYINAGIYQRWNISTQEYINAGIYQRRNISTQEYINAYKYQHMLIIGIDIPLLYVYKIKSQNKIPWSIFSCYHNNNEQHTFNGRRPGPRKRGHRSFAT